MSNNQDLLDLLGGLGSETISSTTIPSSTIATNDNNLNNTNGNNILSMLPATTTTLSPLSPTSGDILSNNLFDDLTTGNSTNSSNGSVKITALDKNGLNITLVPNKSVGDGCLRVVMLATNNSLNTLEQYLFQAAVPKSFTLQMLSPSGSVLPPGGTITQEMRLTNSSKVRIPSNPSFFGAKHLIVLCVSLFRVSYECDFVYRMWLMVILCWSKLKSAAFLKLLSIKSSKSFRICHFI